MEENMNNNTKPQINFLVFGGGGAAGISYAGAIDQLKKEPEFSFAQIKQIVVHTIGSIAALLVSLNYSPAEMMQKWNYLICTN